MSPRNTVQPSQDPYIFVDWIRWNPVLWHAFFDSAGRPHTEWDVGRADSMSDDNSQQSDYWDTLDPLKTGSLVLLPCLNL